MRRYCKVCQFQVYEYRNPFWYDIDGWAGSVAGSDGLWHNHVPPYDPRPVERAVEQRSERVKPEAR